MWRRERLAPNSHLDAHDTIVVLHVPQQLLEILLVLPLARVARDDPDVLDGVAALLRRPQDVLPLRVRVADGGDLAVGTAFRHVQRQGAPAAAQVDHAHPVAELGSLQVEVEHLAFQSSVEKGQRRDSCGTRRQFRTHGDLARLQAFLVRHALPPAAATRRERPQAPAVLLVRSQAQVVEPGGHLVVLGVRRRRLHGDGRGPQLPHDGHLPRLVRRRAALPQLEEGVPTPDADGGPDEGVREEGGRRPRVQEGQARVAQAGEEGRGAVAEPGEEAARGQDRREEVAGRVEGDDVVGADVVVGPRGGEEGLGEQHPAPASCFLL